jgi:subtilisin family serine protease
MLTRHVTAVIAAGLAAAAAVAVPAAAATGDKLPSGAYSRLVSDILKAQTLSTGQGVTVAVISTGVDPSDPALSGKVTTGPDLTFKPRVSLADEYGTAVASIIAGRGPTGSQPLTALGVAPDAKILSIRALPDPSESGANSFFNTDNISDLNARAIDYAVAHGAQVIYVEVDSGDPTAALANAVAAAAAKKAIIVAAAFGDSKFSSTGIYPPGLPGVIGVGSINMPGGLPMYNHASSQHDNAILIAGPANTFTDSSGYGIDGPGAAAAIVAGTVALIKSLYPGMTVSQVEQTLARSARYHPQHGYDTTIGFGMVDPYSALEMAGTISKSPASAPPAGVALSSSLASGQTPGTINAVHHSAIKLIIGVAAFVAGLALIVAGLITLRRGGRRRGRRRVGDATAAF